MPRDKASEPPAARIKRVSNQNRLELLTWHVDDRNDIESGHRPRPRLQPAQVRRRGSDELSLLGSVDRLGGRIARRRAGTNFDEAQDVPLPRDAIDLAAASAPISFDDREAVVAKDPLGERLLREAPRLRWAVHMALQCMRCAV